MEGLKITPVTGYTAASSLVSPRLTRGAKRRALDLSSGGAPKIEVYIDSQPDENTNAVAILGLRPFKRRRTVAPAKHETSVGRIFCRDGTKEVSTSDIGTYFEVSKPDFECHPSQWDCPVKSCKISSAVAPTAHEAPTVDKDFPVPTPQDTTPVATPKAVRQYNALSKKVPVTPRHRVGLIGKPITPGALRTPSSVSKHERNTYTEGRQLFARSHQSKIIGRENERKEIHDFIESRLSALKSGCMYVSGPPGTGKSALVNDVCAEFKDMVSVKISQVNCMSLKTAQDLYGRLVEDLDPESEVTRGSETEYLQRVFRRKESSHTYLIVLDEIDHLLSVDLEILYALFSWSMQASSTLVMIGIANALDLADRFLPRLKARNLKPHLLPFLPYSVPQITSILTARLRSTIPAAIAHDAPDAFVPYIHPAALLFCAKKVASQNGDLRKAFDICQRAISQIEAEACEKHETTASFVGNVVGDAPLMENMNLSSPLTPIPSPRKCTGATANPLPSFTALTAPRATIAHMARVTAAVFTSTSSANRLCSLNLNQKAALCALAATERRNREDHSYAHLFNTPQTPSKTNAQTAPSVASVFARYMSACKGSNLLAPLSSSEFGDVVEGLEALGLVAAADTCAAGKKSGDAASRRKRSFGGRRGKTDERKVALTVGEAEVKGLMDGSGVEAGMLRKIMG